MAISPLTPIYDYFLNFVVEKATPQEILAFQIPEAERQRAIDLLEKQDDGTLTPNEAQMLDEMQRVDRMISAMKARALAALKQS
jgi:hypothetical protein